MPTLTAYPSADLAGDWERDQPSPVDAASYTEPNLLGFDTAGYASTDSDSDAVIPEALSLPEIGVAGGGAISFIGSDTYDGSTTYSTTHSIGKISATAVGDLIEIVVQAQDEPSNNLNASCPGFTQRQNRTGSTDFRPSYTKLYRIADGTEASSFTVTISGSYRVMMGIRVWRGVDQANPYDFANGSMSQSDGTGSNPDPGSVTTVTDNAVVTVDFFGDPIGSWNPTSPSGYSRGQTSSGTTRNLSLAYRTNAIASIENPGAWTQVTSNWTLSVDAIRPAASVDLTAIVITSVTDTTETTGTPAAPVLSGATFTLATSMETPRTSTWRPQIYVWVANVTSYTVGATIEIDVSDHDSLHSWAATLLIYENLENGTEIEVVGTEGTGFSQAAQFGTATPLTLGSKVLAVMASSASGWHYGTSPELSGTAPLPSEPTGYTEKAVAVADATLLAVWESPPLSTSQAESPGDASWTGVQDWTTGLLVIRPDDPSSSSANLYDAVNSGSQTSWIDIAPAAGNMDEVLELDLGELPAAAVITSAQVHVVHASAVENPIRLELVGINADDTVVYSGEHVSGYRPASFTDPTTVETASWRELADGSDLFDYSRLGVRLHSNQRVPGLTTHRVYSVWATIQYLEGGPVVSNVVGPTTAGDAIAFDYDSESGLAMVAYRVLIQNGSGQDPTAATTPANPIQGLTDGDTIYDSGRIPGNLRSVLLDDAPMARGDCTVSIKAWARTTEGKMVESAWSSDDFSISGAAPTSPTASGGAPTFDETTGRVQVEFTPGASGQTRAWLLRSADSGATWAITPESPYAISGTGAITLDDNWAPHQLSTVRYKVATDEGANYETSVPADIDGTDIATTHLRQPDGWYLIVPADPTLNVPIEVSAVTVTNQRRSVVANQVGDNVVTTTPVIGRIIELSIRTRDAAKRLAVEAVIASSQEIRLVNVLGQEWITRLVGDDSPDLQRWQALSTESTGIRDAHVIPITLVEVRENP